MEPIRARGAYSVCNEIRQCRRADTGRGKSNEGGNIAQGANTLSLETAAEGFVLTLRGDALYCSLIEENHTVWICTTAKNKIPLPVLQTQDLGLQKRADRLFFQIPKWSHRNTNCLMVKEFFPSYKWKSNLYYYSLLPLWTCKRHQMNVCGFASAHKTCESKHWTPGLIFYSSINKSRVRKKKSLKKTRS